MKNITIKINLENAAFSDRNKAEEVSRILKELSRQLDESDRFQFRKIYDINGNAVGTVTEN